MRKLGEKKEPELSESLANESLVKTETEMQKEPVVEKKPKELPKSQIHKRLNKLSSFKKLKKNYKLSSQKELFVNDLKSLLCHLNTDEHKYDAELLVEVMNACEEFFIYGNKEEREQSKSDCIFELMMPFFDNKEILEKFMLIVDGKVKKSNWLKRFFKKLSNFFF